MKLLIVTGGSRGLGKALVDQYSSNEEWHIVELSRSGVSIHHVYCDLANVELIEKLSGSLFPELACKPWDEIVYINNAGDLQPISSIGSLKTSDIITNISLNQISAFILISAFIAAFRTFSVRKSIVNLSSGAALKGYAGWSLYCASKAACENFINAASVEEEFQAFPFIAVNYDPSVMDTSMQASIRDSDKAHFPAKARFIDYKENGVLCTPEYVASDLIKKIHAGMVNNTRYGVE
jgi:NAD(P)-dependent dehydrogenase (short-subunit alcohol dehydrogenase family)